MASPSPDPYRRASTPPRAPRPDPAPVRRAPRPDAAPPEVAIRNHAVRMTRVYGLLVRDLQRYQSGKQVGANTMESLRKWGITNPNTPIQQLGKLKVKKS